MLYHNYIELYGLFLETFLQTFFDSVEEELQCSNLDSNVVVKKLLSSPKISEVLKKIFKPYKEKGIEWDTLFTKMSQYWSSFDYDLMKVVIKECTDSKSVIYVKMKKYCKLFKSCSLQHFLHHFQNENTNLESQFEKELKVTIKNPDVALTLKYIRNTLCKSLKEILKISQMRLLLLKDCFSFTFAVTQPEVLLPFTKEQIYLLSKDLCISELTLDKYCFYGLGESKLT